uniref:Uncharacterized protein n=1 Tax=Arundo donax TaxID=35708 RepID=A0A0A9HHC4_ARUDO
MDNIFKLHGLPLCIIIVRPSFRRFTVQPVSVIVSVADMHKLNRMIT